ncbi:hypothetical protein N0V88_008082 [Collariella sp. IMI 366227]|nr:hypothetical protein N0V88_008082 [Collariella sp. IMI 366227]
MSHPTEPFAADSAVLAASVGAAALYSTMVRSTSGPLRTVAKTGSTALLSVVATMRGGPLLLAGALGLGSLGDFFLALKDSETNFLCGLGSFLVAHMLYIAVFFQANNDAVVDRFQILLGGWRAATAGALTLLVPVMIGSLVPRIASDLRPPVVVYSLTIFVMTLTALTLDSTQVIVGALMFTGSDSILAADRFLVSPTSSHRGLMQHAVWVLYYGAHSEALL